MDGSKQKKKKRPVNSILDYQLNNKLNQVKNSGKNIFIFN